MLRTGVGFSPSAQVILSFPRWSVGTSNRKKISRRYRGGSEGSGPEFSGTVFSVQMGDTQHTRKPKAS